MNLNNVGRRVWHSVRDSVQDSVYNFVWGSDEDSIWGSVKFKNELSKRINDEIGWRREYNAGFGARCDLDVCAYFCGGFYMASCSDNCSGFCEDFYLGYLVGVSGNIQKDARWNWMM